MRKTAEGSRKADEDRRARGALVRCVLRRNCRGLSPPIDPPRTSRSSAAHTPECPTECDRAPARIRFLRPFRGMRALLMYRPHSTPIFYPESKVGRRRNIDEMATRREICRISISLALSRFRIVVN